MATEDILIRYRADVGQLEADLNKVITQQEELVKATNENTTATNKAVSSQQLAAKKRAQLLDLEVQKLKKLQEAQKLAFDPEQIQKYNNQISESQKRIDLLANKSQSAANSIGNAFKGAAAALTAAFSVGAITQFAKSSIDGFIAAEKAAGRLRSNIVTLGKEGEDAFKALNDQAEQLQKKTLFDADNIKDAASQLSAFGLSATEIQQVIPGILDFAQAFEIDLGTAINQIGPALDGVAGRLGKYGLQVSESASRTENLASVLQFTAQYAGQAEAATNTLAGALFKKQKEIEDLQDAIGERLVPAYLALGKAQLGVISFFERLSAVISENAGFFKALIPVLVTYLGYVTRAAQISAAAAVAEKAKAVAVGLSAAATKTAAFFQNLYNAAVKKGEQGEKAYTAVTEAATVAQKGFNNAVKSNPLGLLLGVLSTVVLLYQEFADSANEVSEATSKQKENLDELNQITTDYNKNLALEKGELDRLFNSVKQYNTGSKERQKILNEINAKYGTTLQNLDDEKKFVEALKVAYDQLLPSIEAKFKLEISEARFKKAIEQQFEAAEALKNAELDRAKALEEVDKAQQKANKSAKTGQLQSGLGGTGNLAQDANFAQQRLNINKQYNLDKLKADKDAADKQLQQTRDLFTQLQVESAKNAENIIFDIEKLTQYSNQELLKLKNQFAKDQSDAGKKYLSIIEGEIKRRLSLVKGGNDAEVKLDAEKQKALLDQFNKFADEFLKARNEADQKIKDIEFNITLNTQGLAPAIDQFAATSKDELQGVLDQLKLQIEANPLFENLTDKEKLALAYKQFEQFVNDVDKKWSDAGVLIGDTSENITAALGPDFLSMPFEEGLKKILEAAGIYLPQFKGAVKDTSDDVISDADRIAKANEDAAKRYAESWIGANAKILESTLGLFKELQGLFNNITNSRLDELQKQTDAELENLDTREKANQEQFDNRAVSEQQFLEEQTRIENERIALQEETAAREKEIKKQQFAVQQAIAIFEIGLATAKALGEINANIAAYQAGLPVTAPLLANAQLARILLLATSAAQVGAVLAQPKPYRKGSKNTGPSDHMARVGEEGEEIVFMPANSKVLPARQTRKYGEMLDAMFDNKIDKYVLDKYVTPALMEQKKKFDNEKGRSFADNLAKSIYFNGGLNETQMERIRKKGHTINNVDEIASAIAKKLPIRDIYRA